MKRRFLLTTHFDFIALRRFKDRQFAEVVTLVTGLLTVGKLNDGVDKFFQQLRHRFTVDQLTRVKVDPVFFFAASSLLVAIFTVGTNPPYGVPRPVLNSTIWQPAPARALVATASLPGALNKFSPGVSDARRNAARQPRHWNPLSGYSQAIYLLAW